MLSGVVCLLFLDVICRLCSGIWPFKITKNETGTSITWAASCEKVPLNMRKIHRFRSACAVTRYQPGLYSPFIRL